MADTPLSSEARRRLRSSAGVQARRLLEQHHPAMLPPVPVELIALGAGYRIGRKKTPGQVTSFTYLAAGGAAVLGVNTRLPPARARFAIAHALGHGQLHDKTLVVCAETRCARAAAAAGSSYPSLAMDYEASAFATALLAPGPILRSAASDLLTEHPETGADRLVAQLATLFMMPRAALAHRLIEMGIILP